MASAAIVYLNAVFRPKKRNSANIDNIQKRIDRERQEKFEILVQETRRVETRDDILAELNRRKHVN